MPDLSVAVAEATDALALVQPPSLKRLVFYMAPAALRPFKGVAGRYLDYGLVQYRLTTGPIHWHGTHGSFRQTA